MRAHTRKCDVRGCSCHTPRRLQQIAISCKRFCYNKFQNNYELHQFKGTGSGRSSPDSRWRPFIIVTAVRKSDRSYIGAFLPDLFIGSRRFQAFAFCVFLFLVVHLSATTSVRSDAAPWVVSSRQCRMGPDLERSTPTWPKTLTGPVQGRWERTHGDQSPVKVRSFEAAMAAWGPEDCATKVELAAALKRAKKRPAGREEGRSGDRPSPENPSGPPTLRALRITTVSSSPAMLVAETAWPKQAVAKTGRGQNKKTIGQKPAVSTTGHARAERGGEGEGRGRARGGAERGAGEIRGGSGGRKSGGKQSGGVAERSGGAGRWRGSLRNRWGGWAGTRIRMLGRQREGWRGFDKKRWASEGMGRVGTQKD